jgi:D-glycero-D-manno-heptose 1,7-bisphosphate phosphatase
VIAFLDRDGTINVKQPEGEYVEAPDELILLPGAADAIARLNAAGIPVAVVTNQRGIALGLYTEDDLAAVHARLDALLAAHGARVDRYEFCPHDRGVCACRKPGTEMLERAAAALGVEPSTGVMIGDAESDVEAGRAVGARTFRVGHDVASLAQAVDEVLAAHSSGDGADQSPRRPFSA